ncbi:MAG: hypothetical protein L0Y38_12655 [Methylococcaceae bacterium]|nr:hypothetical protein [Methylococcaceae bacterium]MCI0734646.1 hypothetical protein [Methylococcaceae bacterium]
MLKLPVDLSQKFNELLTKKSFPDDAKASCLKWMRFYWDFCAKYHYDPFCSESLPGFLQKLVEKRQFEQQQKQAVRAITLFYRMQYGPTSSTDSTAPVNSLQAAVRNQSVTPAVLTETGSQPLAPIKQDSPVERLKHDNHVNGGPRTGSSWVFVYETLNSEIKLIRSPLRVDNCPSGQFIPILVRSK